MTSDKNPRRSLKLLAPSRWLLGLMGMLGLVLGGLAVFTREVEAGPVALLVLGAFFLLIGLLGSVPARLKWGDAEVSFEEIGEALAEVVDLVPAEDREQADSVVASLSQTAPEVASVTQEAAKYEKLILAMLDAATEESDSPWRLDTGPRLTGIMLDAVIESTTRKLIIEIKYNHKPMSVTQIFQLQAKLGALDLGSSNVSLLLISRRPLSAAASEALRALRPQITAVSIEGPEDQMKLNNAVRTALSHGGR